MYSVTFYKTLLTKLTNAQILWQCQLSEIESLCSKSASCLEMSTSIKHQTVTFVDLLLSRKLCIFSNFHVLKFSIKEFRCFRYVQGSKALSMAVL